MRIISLVAACVFAVTSALTAAAQDKPKIGMPMTTLNDAFWVDYVNFAKTAAEAYGYELVVTDAQGREDKQLSDIETLINAGVKGVILTPLSEPLGIQAINLLDKAKIPVVVTDTFRASKSARFRTISPSSSSMTRWPATMSPSTSSRKTMSRRSSASAEFPASPPRKRAMTG